MVAVLKPDRSILFAALAICLGCNQDFTIQLPNGYFVARVHSGAFAIVNPSNRAVTDQSHQGIAVAVADDVVMGEIDPTAPDPDPAAARHFVINTKTNEVWHKLSRQEYLRRLQSVGIKAPPRLVLVDRFVTLRTLRTSV